VRAEQEVRNGHRDAARVPLRQEQVVDAPEQVQILAGVLGRSLDYVAIPDPAIRKAMVDMGMAADWADGSSR
jgi:hypothetical protein